jgi:hypothetical protein
MKRSSASLPSLLLLLALHAYAAPWPAAQQLANAALEQTRQQVRYDPAYIRIPYPGGDVPADTGVCTDVVIRAYRTLGIDLQKEVHEEMRRHFQLFPKHWGLGAPDSNIDHRRVLNLQTFFSRRGELLPVSMQGNDYQSGDLVTWTLPGNLPHIGIVATQRSQDGQRPMVIHNIGAGPQLEDRLFDFPISGHYRYRGPTP